MTRARGTFQVKLTPQALGPNDEATLGRLTIDKSFSGDLEGTSKGHMLAAATSVDGSAGYVALERVNGTLAGRSGTFVLQHYGIMTRGAPQLTVTVVPDSGTADLEGISGRLTIEMADGRHSYDFEYEVADTQGTPPNS